MSKAQDLQAIIQAAWGDDDPITQAYAAGEQVAAELESPTDLTGLDSEQLRAEAERWRQLAKTLYVETLALSSALVKAPGAVGRARGGAGAAKKLANDGNGKQAAKVEAKKLWQDWQAGKTLHKSGAAFARFVCDKYPVLESPTTVERWARKWAVEKSKNRH